jgi:hypothetical protein
MFKRLIRPLVDPAPSPVLYVVCIVLLSVISNALYDLVLIPLGDFGRVLAIAVGIMSALLAGTFIANWLASRAQPRIAGRRQDPCRGVIVLVSQGVLSTLAAHDTLRYHQQKLAYVWLIYTATPTPAISDAAVREPNAQTAQASKPESADSAQPQTSGQNAFALKALFTTPTCEVRLCETRDADDFEGAFDAACTAIRDARRAGLGDAELTADVTGGTKSMTTAVVMASVKMGTRVSYLRPRVRLATDGRADAAGEKEAYSLDLLYRYAP